MKSVFSVELQLHERGTRYAMREYILVVAKDVTTASERAEKHTRAVYKRRSVPLTSIKTVAVKLLGEVIT